MFLSKIAFCLYTQKVFSSVDIHKDQSLDGYTALTIEPSLHLDTTSTAIVLDGTVILDDL